MPNSLNTRLLRVTNEEENGEVRTQIRPREYNYSISYVDNFDSFVPYCESTSDSDIRINYDYVTHGTTLSDSADARLSYSSLNSVSLKFLETVKELQQSIWSACFKFKYNKKSKVFYNKI